MKSSNPNPEEWKALHNRFLQYRTGHARLLQVTAELRRTIQRRKDGMIIVAGPTRVGKTTLLQGVINGILSENLLEMEKDPGFIPAAWMEAYAYKRGYKWCDHWYGCLKALNEPLIDKKSAGYDIAPDRSALHAPIEHKYQREDILRRSFENAARHRRTRVIAIDEAQSIVLGSSENMHRANVEVIKSVANTSGALHVLCGNYDVLNLFNLSGQIGARTGRPVHFSRYTSSTEDLIAFKAVVLDLTSRMPFDETPRFDGMLDYVFERSLGLIGLVKIWFSDALGDVLENGRTTVTGDDLEKYEPPEAVLDRISREIVAGEQVLAQDGSKFELIRARMIAGANFNEHIAAANTPESELRVEAPVLPGMNSDPQKTSETKRKPRPRRSAKPFERTPTRDKVGEGRKNRVA